MCLGVISVLLETWDDEGVRVGKLADGRIVPLSFAPDAVAGDVLLLHLGIAVEVLTPDVAQTALALRSTPPATLNENGAT